jgi:glycerol-3-phosphate dehydrogenase
MMPNSVLILGAGINGAALARELALNDVGVVIVDTRDIAAGATAYSSRLIHGGLRYLEYGDFALVRESLGERTRLLRLAPQFVRPLRLYIPIQNRFGGLMQAARRFLGLRDRPHSPISRGLWTVRFGLWLYDKYARDPTLPKHESHRASDPDIVPVDRSKYGWVCAFSDAQVVYPERFTLALLSDARQIATAQGSEFRVLTYHEATLSGRTVSIRSRAGGSLGAPGSTPTTESTYQFEPSAIINATGAWVDHTLKSLGIESKRLMGGTKGSHFFTSHSRLTELLAGRAAYMEAPDGRPVFILPFINGMLIGTTDEPFDGDPADAVATGPELDYLIAAVNEVFPDVRLTRDDIDMHYAGVRPLPHTDAATPGAVSRRHWMQPHPNCEVPLYSIIGGKLTTSRSLAEEAAGEILRRLGLPRIADSRERQIAERETCMGASGTPLRALARGECPVLLGTSIPLDTAREVIRGEWVTTLDDLVERRLMLLYHPNLERACLDQLADLLIEAGLLSADQKVAAVDSVVDRLYKHFGKRMTQ